MNYKNFLALALLMPYALLSTESDAKLLKDFHAYLTKKSESCPDKSGEQCRQTMLAFMQMALPFVKASKGEGAELLYIPEISDEDRDKVFEIGAAFIQDVCRLETVQVSIKNQADLEKIQNIIQQKQIEAYRKKLEERASQKSDNK
jgi:hypothetical protein